MLLIIFLALIANSALVSGVCDLGTPKLSNFDWNKLTGKRPWYFLLHDNNEFDNNLDCPKGIIARPKCNISLLTRFVYDIGAQKPVQYQGFARNWDSTGYFEVIHQASFWTGSFLVLAVDYDSYFIARHCPLNSDEPGVYVVFRSRRPDIVTWLRVLKELLKNKIDITKLVMFSTNHCQ